MAGFKITDCVIQRAPGRLIRRIDKLMASVIDQKLGDSALNYTQWVTLKLVESGIATAGDLARDLGYTTGATTRLIDGLEQAGMLTRERTDDDRRVVRLAVTPRGQALSDEMHATILDFWNEMVADFDQAEADQLVRSLVKLLGKIEAKAVEVGVGRALIPEMVE